MKAVIRALAFAGIAAAFADAACTSACLRNTDCGSSEACISGTCIVVAVNDGSTVDAMTAKASFPPTPTTSSTAPVPSGTTDVPDAVAPIDAGWTPTEAGYSLPDGF
jgi:hypothetical protein